MATPQSSGSEVEGRFAAPDDLATNAEHAGPARDLERITAIAAAAAAAAATQVYRLEQRAQVRMQTSRGMRSDASVANVGDAASPYPELGSDWDNGNPLNANPETHAIEIERWRLNTADSLLGCLDATYFGDDQAHLEFHRLPPHDPSDLLVLARKMLRTSVDMLEPDRLRRLSAKAPSGVTPQETFVHTVEGLAQTSSADQPSMPDGTASGGAT